MASLRQHVSRPQFVWSINIEKYLRITHYDSINTNSNLSDAKQLVQEEGTLYNTASRCGALVGRGH